MQKPFLIYIIDDDDIFRYTITRSLKDQKLSKEIVVFPDGEKAINFMIDNAADTNSLPDIIFLDINMPIMDGFQFMEEYTKLKPLIDKKIIIYMISSSVNPADIERTKNIIEINDYLIKPIPAVKLGALLNSLDVTGNLY